MPAMIAAEAMLLITMSPLGLVRRPASTPGHAPNKGSATTAAGAVSSLAKSG